MDISLHNEDDLSSPLSIGNQFSYLNLTNVYNQDNPYYSISFSSSGESYYVDTYSKGVIKLYRNASSEYILDIRNLELSNSGSTRSATVNANITI